MHGNVPVRFGRGRLDSLGNKGLAAYLIAGQFGLRAHVEVTDARRQFLTVSLSRRIVGRGGLWRGHSTVRRRVGLAA
jgi:hypothetical protein